MSKLYKFDNFEIDTTTYKLKSNGESLPIEPLVFDLLLFLIQRSGKVVTRNELVDRIWGGRIMSDGTISTAIKSVRKVLGDTGATQKYIRTVRGRGFEFLGILEAQSNETPIDGEHGGKSKYTPRVCIRSDYQGDDMAGKALAKTLTIRLQTILSQLSKISMTAPLYRINEIKNFGSIRNKQRIDLVLDLNISRSNAKLRANVILTESNNRIQEWVEHFEVSNNVAPQELILQKILAQAKPKILAAAENRNI
ncbi:winged helix-turn-helix domain-containing protein [Lentilitoribacter sp. EG35]|uniref:winged helix-turn-helix domain-containing protein n=1 Tax=Lentilitoribacter sp. EG35 TaxID=3234192 RepID=UPI00345FB0F3